ncbi:MAG: phospholipid/cholesterol/gamma-HCH transport system substrate-binding protein [Actinomycetota bacterium]
MTRRLIPFAIGLGFILAVAGLSGVPVIANPLRPAATEITVEFPRTVGLYPQSRVLVQGVRAGTVQRIEPTADRVRVHLTVHDVALAPDAVATVRLRSLIGERYVELGPVWSGTGPRLESGTVIPLSRSRVPAEVNELFDEATRVSEQVDADALRMMVKNLGQALGGNSQAVAGVTSGLSQVGQTLSTRSAELDQSLHALQGVVGTLASRDGEVTSILRSSTAVSQSLLAQQGALDAAVGGLDDMLGRLASFTGNEKDKIAAVLDSLDRVGRILADHEKGWQQIVDLAPYYAYGWYNAIHHDGSRWWLLEQAQGLFFVPFTHPMNAAGGPGSINDDNRVVPAVDYSCSPLRPAVPWQVDATQYTGAGPLLPAGTIGDGFITVNNDPHGGYHAPGYQGAEPEPDQNAPAGSKCPDPGSAPGKPDQ